MTKTRGKVTDTQGAAGEESAEEASLSGESDGADSLNGVLEIIEDLEGQLQSAYAMREAFEQDLAEVSRKLSQLRGENSQHKRRIRYLEDKIPDLQTLREELEFAEQEKSLSQATIAQLKKVVEAKTQELDQQGEKLQSARGQLKEAKAASIKAEYDLAQFEERDEELKALQGEHKKLQREQDQAVPRLKELESNLEEAANTQEQLTQELAAARQAAGALEAEHASLKKENEALEKQNRESEARIAQVEIENEILKRQIENLEEHFCLAQKENERLKADLLASRKTMKNVYAALSRIRGPSDSGTV